MNTAKWIGAILIIFGVGLLIFGVLSFQTDILGRTGSHYYSTEAKVEATFGGVLITAGAFLLKKRQG